MAGANLLALLDDVAAVLDDVAVLTKVAGKKTAGVLGDDLALNAEMVTGVDPKRELAVVAAVAKGSAINKLILVPAALAISFVIHAAIKPLLMIGGLFLCYEGFDKVLAKLRPASDDEERRAARLKANGEGVDLVEREKATIKGAIRTDFVLSAEVVAISLGAVEDAPIATQAGVLVAISVVMTIGVYGLVALIVKLDDIGLHLSERKGALAAVGRGILFVAPKLMVVLSVVGTAAMFLVGGGILVHGVPSFEVWLLASTDAAGGIVRAVGPTLANGVVGVVAGGLACLVKGLVPSRKASVEAPSHGEP